MKVKRPYAFRVKVQKILQPLLRYILPLAALIYLAWVLLGIPAESLSAWSASFSQGRQWPWLVLVLLMLAALNWLLEAFKWQLLARKLQPLSFGRALSGVLYGVSLGMITPKRSGEVAGRVLSLEPGKRWKGVLVNAAGGLTQLGVTLMAGILSLLWVSVIDFSSHPGPAGGPFPFSDASELQLVGADAFQNPEGSRHVATARNFPLAWLLFPVLAFVLLALLVAGVRPLIRRILAWPRAPRWTRSMSVLMEVSRDEMLLLTVLSACRYVICLLQFYLLLRLFHYPMPWLQAVLLLALMYLVMTAVPLSALAEAGVRGAVILLVYGYMFRHEDALPPAHEAALTAAVLGLWLVNLVLPGLAGALLALSGKVPMKTSVA